MLAENLADTYQPTQQYLPKERCSIQYKEVDDPGFKEGIQHYIGKHKFVLLSVLSDESSYP